MEADAEKVYNTNGGEDVTLEELKKLIADDEGETVGKFCRIGGTRVHWEVLS